MGSEDGHYGEVIYWMIAIACLVVIIVVFWPQIKSLFAKAIGLPTAELGQTGTVGGLGESSSIYPDGEGGPGPQGSSSCPAECPICKCLMEFKYKDKPSMSAAEIDSFLASVNSPAKGTGQVFYDESIRTGIDDVFALAFFKMESSFGTDPKAVTSRATKSMGNIKYTSSCYDKYVNSNGVAFCSYKSWGDGIRAWYSLISRAYPNEVGPAICKYAPSSDKNNVIEYATAVRNFAAEHGRSDVMEACEI